MLKLLYPVDPQHFPIYHPYWADETNNQIYKDFYTVFDNHHPGVDFDTPIGTLVHASFPGVVVRNEFHKGMGNVVSIRHGNTLALYAHLERSNVKLGVVLDTGDDVGVSGNTGAATTRPHLHFELRNLEAKTLKESVFEPTFGEPLPHHQDSFTYEINNKNTSKSYSSLTTRYFGDLKYLDLLRSANPTLNIYNDDDTLPDNARLIIPNYI